MGSLIMILIPPEFVELDGHHTRGFQSLCQNANDAFKFPYKQYLHVISDWHHAVAKTGHIFGDTSGIQENLCQLASHTSDIQLGLLLLWK